MEILLKQVIPSYFSADQGNGSDIWNNELCFKKGERIHIVAPSGSGKTSLMHFLYGLRNEYRGEIRLGGKSARQFSAEDTAIWRQQHLSIVFQDLRLFPDHSVYRNLEVKRILQPFHETSPIESMLDRLGIGNKKNAGIATCSYGEQQRIAIIRSLLQPFDFLLLDEPFSHLDERNRSIAMQLIEEEASRRNACILLADLKKIDYFHANRILHL